MSSLLDQIKKSFLREKPFFAILKIARYGYYAARSMPLRWILNAPGLYIGPRFLLLGTKHLRIGQKFYAHSNLWIEAIPHYKDQVFQPEITIGDRVNMGDNVHLSCNQHIRIGNDVLFGSNIYVGDHQHGCYSGSNVSNPITPPALRALSIGQGINIGDRVWVGNNVVILGSVTIGAGAVIAANSVVTSNVSENCIAAGVPAVVLRVYDIASQQWVRS
jgi:acetyltransferase-like isoleucine patch superfamily enzyme